jgi:uncharacterized protein
LLNRRYLAAASSVGNKSRAAKPFKCKRCGWCCTGEGYVNVMNSECKRIAEYLGLPLDQFLEQYTRHEPGFERWLIDSPEQGIPCIFLGRDAEGLALCKIDAVKPDQCRDFPSKWRRDDAIGNCKGLEAED